MTKNEFYAKWLEAFGGGIPKSDIKKYIKVTGDYIWHIFSWDLAEKKRYLTGAEAEKAYDQIDKRGAMYIDWFQDDHTKDMTWDLDQADALEKFVEVYVVGKDFQWTYIKTHEGDFGPYFMMRK
jgi:hypothetical protein